VKEKGKESSERNEKVSEMRKFVRSEVSTEVTMKMAVLWDAAP
jgi:hypothetical protein